MKFLTISTIQDTFYTMPPAMTKRLTEGNVAYVKQRKQSGRILAAYIIPAWRRSVIIFEADSTEQLVQEINQMPGMQFMHFELYPLADFDECMKYVLESLERAEQQSSGTTPK